MNIVVTHKIDYDDYYYLIVPDSAAGRNDVYTVYKVPSAPSKKISIIGRELPLKDAKYIARKDKDAKKT